MRLSHIHFKDHPILQNLSIDFNDNKGEPYANIIFVGENGCGKTSILNELFNYDESQYIIDKEQNYNMCGECLHKSLYVAQDIKYRNAINSLSKRISGQSNIYKDMTVIKNTNGYGGANVMSFNKNNVVNSAKLLDEALDDFNNERIREHLFHNEAKLMDDVSQILAIDGRTNQIEADTFSSGEQELILRLEAVRNRVSLNLDMLLLDEPETSLHPKWQAEIIPFILKILKDNESGERDLQLFVSSHSENVLKSVFDREDTLIVRLYKDNGTIKCQKITNMDTRLPKPTVAEIQYLVFGIVSSEYHNQLYGQLLYKHEYKQKRLEESLTRMYTNNLSQILNPYNYLGRNGKVETLPTYIRNATCHTENAERIFEDGYVQESIEILRDVLR